LLTGKPSYVPSEYATRIFVRFPTSDHDAPEFVVVAAPQLCATVEPYVAVGPGLATCRNVQKLLAGVALPFLKTIQYCVPAVKRIVKPVKLYHPDAVIVDVGVFPDSIAELAPFDVPPALYKLHVMSPLASVPVLEKTNDRTAFNVLDAAGTNEYASHEPAAFKSAVAVVFGEKATHPSD